jgi:general stress protein YciG
MSWYGNSKAHADAGRKGGKSQGKHNNPGNFANNPDRARIAGRKGGQSKTPSAGAIEIHTEKELEQPDPNPGNFTPVPRESNEHFVQLRR